MAEYKYINETGTIVPDIEAIEQEVITEWKDTFGQDLATTPETPQGVMIQAEVLARNEIVKNNSAVGNQFNPNLSGGIFLDAIMALSGIERTKETFSLVIETLTGEPGTLIPQDSVVQHINTGEQFKSLSDVTLNGDGEGSAIFQAVNPGPVQALPNTLTLIIDGVIGWETATNLADAVMGTATQKDLPARAYRRTTLGIQSQETAAAIKAALTVLKGFNSHKFQENFRDIPFTINNVDMKRNSIYLCIDGAADADIAGALTNSKPPGTGYNLGPGIHVTQGYVNPVSGQEITVEFDRPNVVNVTIRVTVAVNSGFVNLTDTVKNLVLQFADNYLYGESGFSVGREVSCFEISSYITREQPTILVKKVEASVLPTISFSTNNIPIAIYERAYTQYSAIIVVVE
jgi:uncharacterized phage protein gp47/JayE